MVMGSMMTHADFFATFTFSLAGNVARKVYNWDLVAEVPGLGEFGAVSVVSGHIRGETNTLPLHVEILYNEYNAIGAFAAASILALLALVTLFAKTIVEWRMKKETDMLNTVLAPEKT